MTVNTYPVFQAWLESLPAGPTWAKANTNRIEAVFTPSNKRPAYQFDDYGILRSYSGSCYDSNLGYLLITGMGHATGCGNDGYYFSTQDMLWHRGWLPSQCAVRSGYTSVWPVDTPISPNAQHLYDNMAYLPVLGKIISLGGSSWTISGANAFGHQTYAASPPGDTTTGPYTYDLTRCDPNKVGGSDGSGADVNDLGAMVFGNRNNRETTFAGGGGLNPWDFDYYAYGACDARVENIGGVDKDVVYTMGSPAGIGRIGRMIIDPVSPANDVYQILGYQNATNPNRSAALLSLRNVMAVTADEVPGIQYARVDIVNSTAVAPLSQNLLALSMWSDAGGNSTTSGGIAADPVRNKFVVWSGGLQLVELDVPADVTQTWAVSVITPSTPNGAPPGFNLYSPDPLTLAGGICGKFVYFPGYDVFAGINDNHEGQVWVYKPANWQPSWSVPQPPPVTTARAAVQAAWWT